MSTTQIKIDLEGRRKALPQTGNQEAHLQAVDEVLKNFRKGAAGHQGLRALETMIASTFADHYQADIIEDCDWAALEISGSSHDDALHDRVALNMAVGTAFRRVLVPEFGDQGVVDFLEFSVSKTDYVPYSQHSAPPADIPKAVEEFSARFEHLTNPFLILSLAMLMRLQQCDLWQPIAFQESRNESMVRLYYTSNGYMLYIALSFRPFTLDMAAHRFATAGE